MKKSFYYIVSCVSDEDDEYELERCRDDHMSQMLLDEWERLCGVVESGTILKMFHEDENGNIELIRRTHFLKNYEE